MISAVLGDITTFPTKAIVNSANPSLLAGGGKRVQQTLYRLYQIYQMGLIEPWVVTDWGNADTENSHVHAVMVAKLPTTFTDACQTIANG